MTCQYLNTKQCTACQEAKEWLNIFKCSCGNPAKRKIGEFPECYLMCFCCQRRADGWDEDKIELERPLDESRR